MAAEVPTGESVTVRLAVTLDHQLRLVQMLTRTPQWRRRYRIRWVLLVVVLPPVAILLGWTVAFLTDPQHGGMAATLAEDLPSLARAALLTAALVLLLMGVERATRRRRLRRATAALLRERPGIDPGDPALTEGVEVTLDGYGFASRTAAGEARIPWSSFRSLDEDDHIMALRTGTWTAFILPKAGMSDDDVATVRRIAAVGLRAPRV